MHKVHKIKSNILAPSNMLVQQYRDEFPGMHTLARKDQYTCYGEKDKPGHSSCADHYAAVGSHCKMCPYIKDVRQSHMMPYGIYNPYTYLAHRLFKPGLIVDEAHNLVSMLTDMASKKLWRRVYEFPSWVTDYRTLHKWVQMKLLEFPHDKKLNALFQDLETGKMRYLVTRTTEPLRGHEEELLKLSPIDISEEKPVLWPTSGKRSVDKIILMSATFSRVDLQQLGLLKKRIIWITGESPIPVPQRPVSFQGVAHYSIGNLIGKDTWDWMTAAFEEHKGSKGLLHMPYGMAKEFCEKAPEHLRDRLVFHDSISKKEVYQNWRASDPSKSLVLVGSGMYEGLDLKGPEYAWQAIVKIPYPSLVEPSLKWLAEEHPERYAWMTVKDVLQASGRICRAPDDYGVTYILDKSFERLYNNFTGLFPEWFKGALSDDRSSP